MSDILKVSVPTGGLENSSRTNPITTNDTNIQNVVDPSKVVKPDGQRPNPDKNLGMNYESNFQGFIAALKNNPDLIESFTQIFFQMGSLITSGIGENFAKEISEFLEMTKMSPQEMVKFLQEQSSQNNKFSSDLFQSLKSIFENTTSVELKASILNFMKSYNDASSSKNILNNITTILKSMTKYMPQSYRQSLLDAAGNLSPSNAPGSSEENILALKRDIIPFLSAYIQRSHDMGKVRDFITLLTLNTARYENGTMEKLFADFQRLSSFQEFRKVFGEDGAGSFDAFLNGLTVSKASNFSDKLLAAMQSALNGEGGYELKSVFQNIMNSFLLNESVYMPLQHYILPADIFGNLLFSEIWVDPNSKGATGKQGEEKARTMLIKFDIKDVGFFDLIILNQGDKIDLQLRYPEKYQSIEKEIKKGITNIVEKNGLVCQKLYLAKSNMPISVSEVFPQIYERKNAINVKI